ncbi:MAG: 3-hydroxyacyl-ACP dehydratase FabZ [Candidatus Sulfotelmatobacter sp.]
MIIEHQEVKSYLRQRYPFLLVDRVLDVNREEVVAIKNVTGTDRCLEGHFPDEPLFPGALLVEAMAQAGSLMFVFDQREQVPGRGYLAKVDRVKFKQFVRPGDQIVLKAQRLRGFGSMARVAVIASVDNVEVGEGEITYYFDEKSAAAATPELEEAVSL